jgi:putative hydrolase of the HAD superfamily
VSAILFDFFGTLVSYSPSRTEQGFPRTHALVPHLGYDEFLTALDDCFARFDAASAADDHEFSMAETAAAFLGRSPDDPAVAEFERTYIAEWSAAVAYPDGIDTLLADLRGRHRLAVVSNTHSPTMVPRMLADRGIAGLFDAVVLSVDVGWRKPHPAMYAAALDALGITAAEAVFVGDSREADFTGPTAAGIRSYLIGEHLGSVFDLPGLRGHRRRAGADLLSTPSGVPAGRARRGRRVRPWRAT